MGYPLIPSSLHNGVSLVQSTYTIPRQYGTLFNLKSCISACPRVKKIRAKDNSKSNHEYVVLSLAQKDWILVMRF